jgi:hypothetical protein
VRGFPTEVSDQFIATHMSKYGQVINGSIKRVSLKAQTLKIGPDMFRY